MLKFDLENETVTIRNYRRRVKQADELNEFVIAESLRGILVQEQDHLIALATALGVDAPDPGIADEWNCPVTRGIQLVPRRSATGIRVALGSSVWRLVRQSLVESAMLSLIGAGLGLILAEWVTRRPKKNGRRERGAAELLFE
jgi:hypothetical protein